MIRFSDGITWPIVTPLTCDTKAKKQIKEKEKKKEEEIKCNVNKLNAIAYTREQGMYKHKTQKTRAIMTLCLRIYCAICMVPSGYLLCNDLNNSLVLARIFICFCCTVHFCAASLPSLLYC